MQPRASRPRLVAAPVPQGSLDDEEPFELPGTEKLGIVGGNTVGKSFLFLAMVYRTFGGPQSGAMSSFLRGIDIFRARGRDQRAEHLATTEVIDSYRVWQRLGRTSYGMEQWYRLRLRYRSGLLGKKPSTMDVEFFDGSGEAFFRAARTPETRKVWEESYADARVMVFCLPLWVAFPAAGRLSREDWRERDDLLLGFGQVIRNYRRLRTENRLTRPVKSILALTMADDRRSGLTRLYDRWISPYTKAPYTYLRQLQSGAGISRYLANARQVSESLHREFSLSRDPRVSSIPQDLDFGGRPWLIPLSAVDGATLDEIEKKYPNPDDRPPLQAPEPAHVELPLLVALCERDNALM